MSKSKLEVLTPENCQLIFIDHQPQMAFGVQSIDRQMLKQRGGTGEGGQGIQDSDHYHDR